MLQNKSRRNIYANMDSNRKTLIEVLLQTFKFTMNHRCSLRPHHRSVGSLCYLFIHIFGAVPKNETAQKYTDDRLTEVLRPAPASRKWLYL